MFTSTLALALLGAFHGVNPGMGWLFAVALGLQERKTSAVWRSLIPLALGHALAVAAAIGVVLLIGRLIPFEYLKWALAVVLLVFGIFRLFRSWHPTYGGMRVGGRQLTIWSFLMASAHGAGLMVLPFVFGGASPVDALPGEAASAVHAEAHAHDHHGESHADHSAHMAHVAQLTDAAVGGPVRGVLAALVHTTGYLLIMGLLAMIVYKKLGLRLLRTAWVNLDLIWAGVLIATAVLTIVI